MNLDDPSAAQKLDPQNLLSEMVSLPDQLERAWALGQSLPLPSAHGFTRVILAGMGSEGIAAELLAAYSSAECPVPVFTQRDYGLPAWAAGEETLVIALSFTGDDEEILSAFDAAVRRGCGTLVICTGGALAKKAGAANGALWIFKQGSHPRAALAVFFGLLLAAFTRLGWLSDQAELLAGAATAVREQQKNLLISVPAALNPAKRYAGQLVGRWVTIFASGLLVPVARHWKNQINEMAKAPASWEALPEADHNSLAGILNPASEVLMPHTMSLFLASPSDHPRNRLRSLITRQTFMLEGLNTDVYMAPGQTGLAQVWTAIHFGDYMAYYLALAYAIDPALLEPLSALQSALAGPR